MPARETKPQSIDDLRKRYEALNTTKITAEANHSNAQKQLDELKASAKAQWATDDLDELRAKLREMEDENERRRSEYQAQLDKIEADLKRVDLEFSQTQEKP